MRTEPHQRRRAGASRQAARRMAAALTLVETLAALLILSAVVAATIGVAGPMSASQRRLAAVEVVRTTLDRGRLLAQSVGGAELMFGRELLARAAHDRESPPARLREMRSSLPRGWSAALVDPAGREGAPVSSLRFSAGGFSANARIVLSGPGGDAIHIELLGISGQLREIRPDTEAAAW